MAIPEAHEPPHAMGQRSPKQGKPYQFLRWWEMVVVAGRMGWPTEALESARWRGHSAWSGACGSGRRVLHPNDTECPHPADGLVGSR